MSCHPTIQSILQLIDQGKIFDHGCPFYTMKFHLFVVSAFVFVQSSLGNPVPKNNCPDCSSSYAGGLIADKFDPSLSWGYENGKSCQELTAPEDLKQSNEDTLSPNYSQMAQELLQLTNAHRQGIGIGTLKLNEKLNLAAQKFSELQAKHQTMTHSLPESPDLMSRFKEVGYVWRAGRENVAWNQQSVPDVFRAWLNSPGHKDAIEDPSVTEMGFGFAVSNGPYWTQMFSAPQSDN